MIKSQETILKAMSQASGESIDEIKKAVVNKCRKDEIVMHRQIFHYLLHKEMEQTYEYIGKTNGGFHHSSVINSCRRVDESISFNDPSEIGKYWLRTVIAYNNLLIDNDPVLVAKETCYKIMEFAPVDMKDKLMNLYSKICLIPS